MAEPAGQVLTPELMRAIDAPCDDFDRAWRDGRRPDPGEFLSRVPEAVRPLLLDELVRTELEWRFRRGESPGEGEYAGRFPGRAAELGGWLDEARSAADSVLGDGNAPSTGSFEAATPQPSPDVARAGPAADPPRLGVLGEYDLLEPLGRGGMGEVYKARHRRLGKLVAVKVLPSRAGHDRHAVARFHREMRAVGQLDHPHLVEAHDAGEHDGTVFLVMKLIDGTDLARLVRERGPLPVGEACELARQAALGLQHLHERGLVHRDVKPSNLMRAADGTVKVLDLGLARWGAGPRDGEAVTGDGMALGTLEYMAPEQAGDPANVDIRADVYGLGATLVHLLTGRPPFPDRGDVYGKLKAHKEEPPPNLRALRPEVPVGLADLVSRMLAKRPGDRPQTPGEVAEALAAFTGDTETETIALPPAQWGGRRWLAAAGGLAVVAVLAAILAEADRRPRVPEQPGPVIEPPAVAAPLRVLKLEMSHVREVREDELKDLPLGLLGRDTFTARPNDKVEVRALLSRPAYAYLIAYRADGAEEVCFPEKDEPPTLTDRPSYPSVSRGDMYGLDEGEGLHAFAVVASDKPLPAYSAWRAGREAPPWGRLPGLAGVVWLDDGSEVRPLTADDPTGTRAKGAEVPGRTPLVALTDWLRRGVGVEAVTAVAFTVKAARQ